MGLFVRRVAAREVAEAEAWYEERHTLGFEFSDGVIETLARIELAPHQFPKVRGVFFVDEGSDQVVLAVLHQAVGPDRMPK